MSRVKMFSRAALAVALLGMGAAHAAVNHYTSPDGVVKFALSDAVCSGLTRDVLREEYADKFHNAVITVGKTKVNACWFGPDEEGDLIIINEAGQGMTVPARSLKKLTSR